VLRPPTSSSQRQNAYSARHRQDYQDDLLKADVKKIELTKKDAIRKKDENY
jgi:hypothetical protein